MTSVLLPESSPRGEYQLCATPPESDRKWVASRTGHGVNMTETTFTPDLLGIQLNHRAMIADAQRLATITADIAAGRRTCDRKRADAITAYLGQLCESVHHHHHIEDTVLWPTLIAAAGDAVDLRELSDDHDQLDPLLAAVRAGCAELRIGNAEPLAVAMARLHEVLAEHIADEERTIFPIITGYVAPQAWDKVETAARKGSKTSFDLPRMAAVATPDELARVIADGGLPLRVMLTVFSAGLRRRERVIAGR